MGTPNIAGDAEVNGVDAFAYNGELQYDAERWDRGTELANGSTSTSSPTLHVVAIPTTLNAGTSITDNGLSVGTVASTTSYGSTTITLSANAAHAVSSGDTLVYVGPGNAAVQNGEGVGCYSFEPFDGSSDSNTAQMCATATETQVHGTNNGTGLIFSYTPNASSGNLRYAGIGVSPGGLGGVTVGDKGYQSVPTDLGKGTLNVVSDIMSGDHFRSSGTAPTLSGCPSGATITGTDNAGFVYFGSGGTSCTVNFHKAWASTPVCIVQNYANTSPVAYPDGVGTGQVSIKQSGTFTGNALYICQGIS